MSLIKKAVFPVGGFGTRFLPATKSMPKEMLPVDNKPLIQHAFEEAKQAGIEQFIFITGRNKNSIIDHFDQAFELEQALEHDEKNYILQLTRDFISTPGNIIFIRQQQPLGLGHAVWCARHVIGNEPFAVLLADELFITPNKEGILSQMMSQFHGDNLIAVSEIDPQNSNKYGMISLHDAASDLIVDMVEKPDPSDAPSNLAIVGRYILQPQIFHYLEELQSDAKSEVQLTDAMRLMLKKDLAYRAFKVGGERIDCGSYLGFLEANIKVAIQNPAFAKQIKTMIKQMATTL